LFFKHFRFSLFSLRIFYQLSFLLSTLGITKQKDNVNEAKMKRKPQLDFDFTYIEKGNSSE